MESSSGREVWPSSTNRCKRSSIMFHPFGARFGALFSIKREKIRLLISLLYSLGHLDGGDNRGCRYIRACIRQPPATSGGPYHSGAASGFGQLCTTIRKWAARIHLDRQVVCHLGFPQRLYRGTPGTFQNIGAGCWSPADFVGFLFAPLHWVHRA